MLAGWQALIPIVAYIVVGAMLRVCRIADRGHAQFIFRLVFFVTLPALAFGAIADSALTVDRLALPAAGFFVNAICAATALACARAAGLARSLAGSVVLGASVTNMVFMFPFILGVLGRDALADAILYDVGNAVFVATVAHAVSARFGGTDAASFRAAAAGILRSPLFLAILSAIVVSANGWAVPARLERLLDPLGVMTMPLILIALGISFSTAQLRDSIVYGTVSIRMLGGLAAGALFVAALGLQGLPAVVVIAAASAPIGFNAVTLASVGKLDVEHATASLSVSCAIGLVTATTVVLIGAGRVSG